MNTIVVKNESEVIEKLKQEIEQRSEEALKTRGIFRVGLSGKFPKKPQTTNTGLMTLTQKSYDFNQQVVPWSII